MSIGYFMIMPNDSQLKLRLPSDLKQKIEEIAESEKRSMNAEIVARLENSFNFQSGLVNEPNSTKLANPYLLVDRKSEISERLIQSIEWINSYKMNSLKYSHIAEHCGYEHGQVFLDWIKAEIEPTFKELKQVAEYFGINSEWLVHGDGKLLNVAHFDTDTTDLDRIFNSNKQEKIENLLFIRDDSEEGNLLIIKKLEGWKIELFTTSLHLSTVNGVGGSRNLKSFAEQCKAIYKSSYLTKTFGYLVSSQDFEKMLTLEKHPLSILKPYQASPWWEAIWDKNDALKLKDHLESKWKDWLETVELATNKQ